MSLNASEIKKLLKNWPFYKVSISSADENNLTKKLSAIENYVSKLDGVDGVIMRMKYFERVEGEIIAARVYITRRAIYKRIDRIIQDMVYWINNIGI